MTMPSSITLDAAQVELNTKLSSISSSLRPGLFKALFHKKQFSGIYIYGSVGCGKTMLSRDFFGRVEGKKLFIHYQDFMRSMHQFFHENQGQSRDDIISRLAQSYSRQAMVICLDEFEIKDITDAMLIGRLVEALIKRGVFVLITTNTAPENLYADGLQRELFLPFIEYLRQKFEIFYIKSEHDYRLDRIATAKRILYPLTTQTKKLMQQNIACLTDIDHLIPRKLEVFGRELTLQKTYKSVLVTNFEELCRQMLSYNDYIEICKAFNVIVMEGVPILASDNTDEVIRFINFIDNIYFHRNLLFISMETCPEELYTKGKRSAEFKRTISRLHEMESDSYFNAHAH